MAKLSFYKWYFDKTRELETLVNDGDLTLAQAAELFFAVQHYADTEEKREMSCQVLKILFKSYCSDVDRAIRAYQTLCEVRAESGAKGGKKKAANAAAAAEDPREDPQQKKKFKPPTLTQFRNASKAIAEELGEEYLAYETECLYDELNENKWLLNGTHHIIGRRDWEELITIIVYNNFVPAVKNVIKQKLFLEDYLKFAPNGEPLHIIEDHYDKCDQETNFAERQAISPGERLGLWRNYLRKAYCREESESS